jgi:hypothetical protein
MTPSRAVPLVAARGLWDKFAAPGTAGAVRRAYSRGVPSLVRVEAGQLELAEALTIVGDAGVNRCGLPIYLITSSLPPCAAVAAARAVTPGIFAIEAGGEIEAWPIYRADPRRWLPIGCYLPVTAALNGLSRADLALVESASLVLFESIDIVTDLRVRTHLADVTDEQTTAAIGACAGSAAAIARVSDLVELALLDQRIREAA